MELLLSLVTHPMFASVLLGTATPTLFRLLEEGGLVVPAKAKVWVNIALSVFVSFVPLVVSWAITDVSSDPEVVLGSIGLAFLASEATYRRFHKDYSTPQ